MRTTILTTLLASWGLVAATPGEVLAASDYSCALNDASAAVPCQSPLVGVVHGDVQTTSDGYLFNASADDTPGYVEIDNSTIIDTSAFPLSLSVDVMGVGVPSRLVGDYDVVRGGPRGTWKIEVMAKNSRTTARAACHFKGPNGKILLIGGPDLSRLSGWHTLTCVDDGQHVQLLVDGASVKSATISTGPVSNTAPLLIGAKDTNGGDQFAGWARNVTVSAG